MRAPEFWERAEASAASRLLAPAAALYAAGGALRWALRRSAPAPLPVLCVGALTAGGAGKTPTAIALAGRFVAQGRRVHLLARGYGGSAAGPLRVDPRRQEAAAVGDEALLLAAAAPTWVARDRLAGALAAATAGAEILVLDDGMQDPRLAKTLTLMVVDGDHGFGNGRVIPAGPLREPVARGLARADAVLLIGEDRRGVAARIGAGRPLLRARLVADSGGVDLAGRRVLAFAGIGRPAKFFAALRLLGAEPVACRGFADHHRYSAAEIAALRREADAARALPVTTAKDAARLAPEMRHGLCILDARLEWNDAAALDRLCAERLVVGR